MRIDSSGNLLVGKTSSDNGDTVGFEANSDGSIARFGITDNGATKQRSNNIEKRDNKEDGTKSNAPFRKHVVVGRNLRNWWLIPTQPTPYAHFATYPEKLVEPCIKAGSKVGDTVLDPFHGSGTTGVVALRLGRTYVGVDISQEYLEGVTAQRMQGAQIGMGI